MIFLQRGDKLFDLKDKMIQIRRVKWNRKQAWRVMQNLLDDGFLFDPIALEVGVNVKNKNRKVVQVVKVQPKHTHTHTAMSLTSEI